MKHPNKNEPYALGNLFLEGSLKLFNTPDKKVKYIDLTYKEDFFFEKNHFKFNCWNCHFKCKFKSVPVHLKKKHCFGEFLLAL